MIIRNEIEHMGEIFVYTYSDQHVYIRKTGTEEIYESAYDPIEFKDRRQYEETDRKIEPELES